MLKYAPCAYIQRLFKTLVVRRKKRNEKIIKESKSMYIRDGGARQIQNTMRSLFCFN